MTSMEEMVGRIDERTAIIVGEIEKIWNHHESHDTRLGKLENFRWWLVGGGTAVAGTLAVLLKVL